MVRGRSSIAKSAISKQSQRELSEYTIEDFYDHELDEEDAEMAQLLKEVQKITISNLVQRNRIRKFKEEFVADTLAPPSVSHNLSPV